MPTHATTQQSSFQKVTQDVLDLFELQLELLSVDSQEAKRKLVRAGIFGGLAATIAGSALTVVMIASGLLLGEFTELSIGGAMLVVSVAFFVLVAVLGWIALTLTKAAASAMSETKSEFAENLRWLKATLVSPNSSARNQLRRETFQETDVELSQSDGWASTRSNQSQPTSYTR
ncbi:phage holin family protein [Rubripirellula amarantea]|nr:phage holin family protein [Rubripirellula amarantea]